MYANNPNGLECSHISIFTGIGCSYHFKFIFSWSSTITSWSSTILLMFFSTTDSSWSVFQHRLQRTAPWITARPLPWLSSAFCVRTPDLQFHLNEEALLFFNQAAVMSRGMPQRVDRTADLRALSLSLILSYASQSLLHTLSLHIFIRLTFSISVFLSCIFSLCFFLLSVSLSLSWRISIVPLSPGVFMHWLNSQTLICAT